MASPGPQQYPWWASLVVGFALIGLGAVALIAVVLATLRFLLSAPTDLGTAFIGALGLVLVAIVSNFGAKLLDRRQQIQQEQRAKKAEVYSEFMRFWFHILTDREEDEKAIEEAAVEDRKDPNPDEDEEDQSEDQNEIEAYLRGFTYQLVTWGSEPFIRNYVAFKRGIMEGAGDTGEHLLPFEDVLLEIRRDLGFKNKGLNRGDLLKVFKDDESIDFLVAIEEQSKRAAGSQQAALPNDNRETSGDVPEPEDPKDSG